jgi:hypothetical protein
MPSLLDTPLSSLMGGDGRDLLDTPLSDFTAPTESPEARFSRIAQTHPEIVWSDPEAPPHLRIQSAMESYRRAEQKALSEFDEKAYRDQTFSGPIGKTLSHVPGFRAAHERVAPTPKTYIEGSDQFYLAKKIPHLGTLLDRVDASHFNAAKKNIGEGKGTTGDYGIYALEMLKAEKQGNWSWLQKLTDALLTTAKLGAELATPLGEGVVGTEVVAGGAIKTLTQPTTIGNLAGKIGGTGIKGGAIRAGIGGTVAAGTVAAPETALLATQRMGGKLEQANGELHYTPGAPMPQAVLMGYLDSVAQQSIEIGGGKALNAVAGKLLPKKFVAGTYAKAKELFPGLSESQFIKALSSAATKLQRGSAGIRQKTGGVIGGPLEEFGEERWQEVIGAAMGTPGQEDMGLTGKVATGQFKDAAEQLAIEGALIAIMQSPAIASELGKTPPPPPDTKETRGLRRKATQDLIGGTDYVRGWVDRSPEAAQVVAGLDTPSRSQWAQAGLPQGVGGTGRKAFADSVRGILAERKAAEDAALADDVMAHQNAQPLPPFPDPMQPPPGVQPQPGQNPATNPVNNPATVSGSPPAQPPLQPNPATTGQPPSINLGQLKPGSVTDVAAQQQNVTREALQQLTPAEVEKQWRTIFPEARIAPGKTSMIEQIINAQQPATGTIPQENQNEVPEPQPPGPGEAPGVAVGPRDGRAGGRVAARRFVHGSALRFPEFDNDKDRGRNLVGPGVYLVAQEDSDVAEHYAKRAIKKMLSVFNPKLRPIIEAAKPGEVGEYIERARRGAERAAAAGDAAKETRFRRAEEVLSYIQNGTLGQHVLEVDFEPKKTLDLGDYEEPKKGLPAHRGGRDLPLEDLQAMTQAVSAYTGAPVEEAVAAIYTATKGIEVYRSLAKKYGPETVNQALLAAGYDSISFGHFKGTFSRPYKVMVALDPRLANPLAKPTDNGVPEGPEPPAAPEEKVTLPKDFDGYGADDLRAFLKQMGSPVPNGASDADVRRAALDMIQKLGLDKATIAEEPKVEQPAGSRIDPATAALDDSGLEDLLKAVGAKVPPGDPKDTYRQRLLSAVEEALYKPTPKKSFPRPAPQAAEEQPKPSLPKKDKPWWEEHDNYVFTSGAQRSPKDIQDLKAAAKGAGVSMYDAVKGGRRLSPAALEALAGAANEGPVFVDSGAFTAFTKDDPYEEKDWDKLFQEYRAIAGAVKPIAREMLHFVAPDVVGDQEASLNLQSQYAGELASLAADFHSQVMIPVQVGDTEFSVYTAEVSDFGGEDGTIGDMMHLGKVTWAFPYNEKAWTEDELVRQVGEYLKKHGSDTRPLRIHLLGGGEKKAKAVFDRLKDQGNIVVTGDSTSRLVNRPRAEQPPASEPGRISIRKVEPKAAAPSGKVKRVSLPKAVQPEEVKVATEVETRNPKAGLRQKAMPGMEADVAASEKERAENDRLFTLLADLERYGKEWADAHKPLVLRGVKDMKANRYVGAADVLDDLEREKLLPKTALIKAREDQYAILEEIFDAERDRLDKQLEAEEYGESDPPVNQLGEQEQPKDPNVNEFGVFVDGIEELGITTLKKKDKATAIIKLAQGADGKWHMGYELTNSMHPNKGNEHLGISAAPSIKKSYDTRKEAYIDGLETAARFFKEAGNDAAWAASVSWSSTVEDLWDDNGPAAAREDKEPATEPTPAMPAQEKPDWQRDQARELIETLDRQVLEAESVHKKATIVGRLLDGEAPAIQEAMVAHLAEAFPEVMKAIQADPQLVAIGSRKLFPELELGDDKPFGDVDVHGENDFYGREVEVLPNKKYHSEGYEGKVVRVLNGGSLIEVRPAGSETTFRVRGELVKPKPQPEAPPDEIEKGGDPKLTDNKIDLADLTDRELRILVKRSREVGKEATAEMSNRGISDYSKVPEADAEFEVYNKKESLHRTLKEREVRDNTQQGFAYKNAVIALAQKWGVPLGGRGDYGLSAAKQYAERVGRAKKEAYKDSEYIRAGKVYEGAKKETERAKEEAKEALTIWQRKAAEFLPQLPPGQVRLGLTGRTSVTIKSYYPKTGEYEVDYGYGDAQKIAAQPLLDNFATKAEMDRSDEIDKKARELRAEAARKDQEKRAAENADRERIHREHEIVRQRKKSAADRFYRQLKATAAAIETTEKEVAIEGRPYKKAKAETFGDWAVVQVRDEEGLPVKGEDGGYDLIHMPSGKTISTYKTASDAKQLASLFIHGKADYQKGLDGDAAQKKLLKELYRMFNENEVESEDPEIAKLFTATKPEPNVKADVIVDSDHIPIGSPGHKIIKELAAAVPEFAYKPIMEVTDKGLIYKDGATYKFSTDALGLTQSDLEGAKTVGINLADLGIQPLTAKEAVMRALKDNGFANVRTAGALIEAKWGMKRVTLSGHEDGWSAKGDEAGAKQANQILEKMHFHKDGPSKKPAAPKTPQPSGPSEKFPALGPRELPYLKDLRKTLKTPKLPDSYAELKELAEKLGLHISNSTDGLRRTIETNFKTAAELIDRLKQGPVSYSDIDKMPNKHEAQEALSWLFTKHPEKPLAFDQPAVGEKAYFMPEMELERRLRAWFPGISDTNVNIAIENVYHAIKEDDGSYEFSRISFSPYLEKDAWTSKGKQVVLARYADKKKLGKKDVQGYVAPQATGSAAEAQVVANTKKSLAKRQVSPLDIEKTMEREFGVPLRYGRVHEMAGRPAGTYDPRNDIARVAGPHMGDLAVASHELAHGIDNRDKVSVMAKRNPAIKKALEYLDYSPTRGSVEEGFAEFVRYLLTDPDVDGQLHAHLNRTQVKGALRTIEPWYRQTFLDANPKLAKSFEHAKQLIDHYRQMSPEERLAQNKRGEEARPLDVPAAERAVELVNTWLDKAKTMFFNPFHYGAKIEAAVAAKRPRGANESTIPELLYASFMASNEAKNAIFGEGVYIIRGDGRSKLSKSLKEVFAPLKHGEYEKWDNFHVARHVFEDHLPAYYNTGSRRSDLRAVYDEVMNGPDKDRFIQISDDFSKFRDALIDMQAEAGVITKDAAKRMKAYYKHHASMKRFTDKTVAEMAKGLLRRDATTMNIRGPLRRSKRGSGKERVPQIDSVIVDAFGAYSKAFPMVAKLGILESTVDNPKYGLHGVGGLGNIADIVRPELLPSKFRFDEILKQLVDNKFIDPDEAAKWLAVNRLRKFKHTRKDIKLLKKLYGTDDVVRLRKLTKDIPNLKTVLMYWRPQYKPDAKDNIEVMSINGKMALVQWHPDVYRMFEEMAPMAMNGLERIFASATALRKVGTTGANTDFSILQIFSDLPNAIAYAKHMGVLEAAAAMPKEVTGDALRLAGKIAWWAHRRLIDPNAPEIATHEIDELFQHTYGQVAGDVQFDPAGTRSMKRDVLKTPFLDHIRNVLKEEFVDAKPLAWLPNAAGLTISGVKNAAEKATSALSYFDTPIRRAEFKAMLRKAGYTEKYDPATNKYRLFNKATGQFESPGNVLRRRGLYSSEQVNMPFRQQGTALRRANRLYLPYLNATALGTGKFLEMVNKARKGDRRAQAGLVVYISYALMAGAAVPLGAMLSGEGGDDEREQYDRNAYHKISGIPGIERIKKPQGPLRLIMNMIEGLVEQAGGNSGAFWEYLAEDINNSFYIDFGLDAGGVDVQKAIEGNVAKVSVAGPLYEAARNKKVFEKKPIIPRRLEGLDPEEQYDEYTSDLARGAGGVTGVSPKYLDFFADRYTGGLPRRSPITSQGGQLGFKNPFRERRLGASRTEFDEAFREIDQKRKAAKLHDKPWSEEQETTWKKMSERARLENQLQGILFDSTGEDRKEIERYLIGNARAAMGRAAHEDYPDPLTDHNAPNSVKELRQQYILAYAEDLLTGDPTTLTENQKSKGLTLPKKQKAVSSGKAAAKRFLLASGLSRSEVTKVVMDWIDNTIKTPALREEKKARFRREMGW